MPDAVLFVLPFLLIQGRGLNPQQAGIVLTAQPIVMAIVAPISGTLSDRIGSRGPATLGMVLLATGLVLLGMLVGHGSLWAIAGALAVVGLGVGFAGAVFTTVVAHAANAVAGLPAGVRAALFVAAGLSVIVAGVSAIR